MSTSECSVNPVRHIREQDPEKVIDLSLTHVPIESPLVTLDKLEQSISVCVQQSFIWKVLRNEPREGNRV